MGELHNKQAKATHPPLSLPNRERFSYSLSPLSLRNSATQQDTHLSDHGFALQGALADAVAPANSSFFIHAARLCALCPQLFRGCLKTTCYPPPCPALPFSAQLIEQHGTSSALPSIPHGQDPTSFQQLATQEDEVSQKAQGQDPDPYRRIYKRNLCRVWRIWTSDQGWRTTDCKTDPSCSHHYSQEDQNSEGIADLDPSVP